jgi:hypothetical protein
MTESDPMCVCGHLYSRHFDHNDDIFVCQACGKCDGFKEAKKESWSDKNKRLGKIAEEVKAQTLKLMQQTIDTVLEVLYDEQDMMDFAATFIPCNGKMDYAWLGGRLEEWKEKREKKNG